MPDKVESLMIMQAVFGMVLVIMGMFMLFFMTSMNIIILYIAVALLCFTWGLTQLLSSLLGLTKKEG
jgi:hypothetical protein